MSHDLSHSQLQSLGLQINPLSRLCLSINCSLHSHQHLSSFHLCLLLQTLNHYKHLITYVSNHYLHLQVSCYSACLV